MYEPASRIWALTLAVTVVLLAPLQCHCAALPRGGDAPAACGGGCDAVAAEPACGSCDGESAADHDQPRGPCPHRAAVTTADSIAMPGTGAASDVVTPVSNVWEATASAAVLPDAMAPARAERGGPPGVLSGRMRLLYLCILTT